jgi:hypothetical protein
MVFRNVGTRIRIITQKIARSADGGGSSNNSYRLPDCTVTYNPEDHNRNLHRRQYLVPRIATVPMICSVNSRFCVLRCDLHALQARTWFWNCWVRWAIPRFVGGRKRRSEEAAGEEQSGTGHADPVLGRCPPFAMRDAVLLRCC